LWRLKEDDMQAVRSIFQRRAPAQGSGPAKMIVGLGNPGPEHARNRHNAGFQVVERWAQRHALEFDKHQKRARLAIGRIELPGGKAEHVLLAKPLTFMNAAGESIGQLRAFYKIEPVGILVVSDDLDLPLGRIRLRSGGGAGGQKGVKSIIQHLGTDEFPRLRVGIGRPPGKMDPVDYVLQNFSAADEETMAIARVRAADAIDTWLASGIAEAMNQFNQKNET
jgi:PTH1 family peptidyl-tRNA hydrolase